MAGQGKIEIVAAEQKVLADGGSLKLQLAVDQASAHQAEVGRAAADVADQNQFAIPEVFASLSQCAWIGRDPCIESG